jgi:hypothetical protein
MKEILLATFIGTMLLAPGSATYVTKSTTNTTSTAPGFEAIFAVAGIMVVCLTTLDSEII